MLGADFCQSELFIWWGRAPCAPDTRLPTDIPFAQAPGRREGRCLRTRAAGVMRAICRGGHTGRPALARLRGVREARLLFQGR